MRTNEVNGISIKIVLPNNTKKVELITNNNCEIIQENGKFFLNKKEIQYPKTYLECCQVLSIYDASNNITGYQMDLISRFRKLLICRNAYRKIAEMELGKPWEPDWTNEKKPKYGLYEELRNSIINPALFVFPTEEMRDTFFENFKDLIVQYK